MKKFLTVLLVIAVMFTFSFGSAFAAPADLDKQITADSARTQLEAEYKTAIGALDKAMADQLETYFPGTETTNKTLVTTLTNGVSEDAVKAVMTSEIYASIKKDIDTQYDQWSAAIEQAIAHKDFVAFSKESGGGNAYPQFDIAAYAYDKAGEYGTVTGIVAASFVISGANLDKVAVEEFKAVQKEASEAADAVNTELYSEKKYPGLEDTHRELAAAIKSKAVSAIANVTLATENATGAEAGIQKIRDTYIAAEGKADPKGKMYEGGLLTDTGYTTIGLSDLLKVADEGTQSVDLEYAKTEVLDKVLPLLAQDKTNRVKTLNEAIRTEQFKSKPDAKEIARLNDEIKDVNDAYDAAVEVVTYLVKNAESVSEIGTIDKVSTNLFSTTWNYTTSEDFEAGYFTTVDEYKGDAEKKLTVKECVARAELVDKAQKQAEKDKVYVGLDGSVAIEIEKALEDAIDDIYRTGENTYKTVTNTTALQLRINKLTGKGKVKINGKEYDALKVWYEYAGSDATVDTKGDVTLAVARKYDEAMYDEIRAIYDETKAAVKAAKTVEEADAAFLAGYAKFDAVPTKAEHADMFVLKTGELKATYEKYEELLSKLATGIEEVELAKTSDKSFEYLEAGDLKTDFIKSVTDDMKATCFTVAELDAAYAKAVETLNNLKTDKQLDDEEAGLIAKIKALPKVATIADKAAVLEARDAVDDYKDYVALVGAGKTSEHAFSAAYDQILDNLVKQVMDAEIDALTDEMEPLAKKLVADTLTAEDASTVKALREHIDAFVKSYTDEDESNAKIDWLEALIKVGSTTITKLEDKIDEIVVDDLVDMISKLAVDPVDAAAVKAAREAFNALSPADQLTFKVLNKTSYDKLVALEKVLAVDVQAIKITASSKATKGAITVKWTVKGNKSSADGYQVWKSTKKNSGFKKAFTTSKTTYKNTKGLKKGVKYYYKVRAYKVVDGKNVYSDWSNKAYRTAQ